MIDWDGPKIRQLREAYDESQEEFCRRFRVSIDTIRFWEQDRGKPSGPATVILDRLEAERPAASAPAAPASEPMPAVTGSP